LKIAIAAPGGNVGRKLVAELLARGEHHLRLLVRRAESVEHFERRGADVLVGSLEDERYLVRSTRDVDAVFWVTPLPPRAKDLHAVQLRMGWAASRALRANGVQRLVNLSAVGESHDGPLAGLRDVERMLERAVLHTTHLRSAYYFENYLSQLDPIRLDGSVLLPVSAGTRIPMIATRDVAWAAAERLLDTGWHGRSVRELLGHADLRFDEAAAVLSRALGRNVTHIRAPGHIARQRWRAAGFSDSVARNLADLYLAMDRGAMQAAGERNAATTTPTRLDEFGRTLLRPLLGGRVAS
jgi:uncharacterized protein YbjT (DUF2867 family)